MRKQQWRIAIGGAVARVNSSDAGGWKEGWETGSMAFSASPKPTGINA